jgi:uncharacterized damage-inducible protein DinB
MDRADIATQVVAAWRRHNEITLYLLARIPLPGFSAVPAGSRGRDVARQFAHLDRVRRGWIHFHETGKRPRLPRADAGRPPRRAQLGRALRESGAAVESFIRLALDGEVRPRLFGGQVLRWMAYLISHEAHHRGQIMLALKQSGMRLPEKVAVQGLWGQWMFGK